MNNLKSNIVIIVLNWENWPATQSCISSILELNEWQESPNQLQLIICDNGSMDGSNNHISSWIEQQSNNNILLLSNKNNLGYAAGNNCAIKYALKNLQSKYIWILNNDTRLKNDSLTHLLDASQNNPEKLIFGSTILDDSQEQIVQCAGGYHYHPLSSITKASQSGLRLENLDKLDNKLDYISGAAMFIRTEAFTEYGLLPEDYFLYYEELDYVQIIGGSNKILWEPKSIIYHQGGSSFIDVNNKKNSIKAQYYENLSTFKFTNKYYKKYLPLVLFIRLVTKPILFIVRKDWHLFRPLLKAYKDFLFSNINFKKVL